LPHFVSLPLAAVGSCLIQAALAAPAPMVHPLQQRRDQQVRHQLSIDESLVSSAVGRHTALDLDSSAAASGSSAAALDKPLRQHGILSGSLSVAASMPSCYLGQQEQTQSESFLFSCE